MLNTVLNDELPPIKDILKRNLRTNMFQVDVRERITQYFGLFHKIVRENGLKELLDRPASVEFK
ncbi:unnamed protein product, partial [Aphanomyces euteiches]